MDITELQDAEAAECLGEAIQPDALLGDANAALHPPYGILQLSFPKGERRQWGVAPTVNPALPIYGPICLASRRISRQAPHLSKFPPVPNTVTVANPLSNSRNCRCQLPKCRTKRA